MPRTPSLKEAWVNHALDLASAPTTLYSGCRKIHRGVRLVFPRLDKSLQLADAGYTSNKMRSLEHGYVHEESIEVALGLWKRRLAQRKYGSVGFTTYNHFIKTDPTKGSKRASVMGPCIQSVVITHIEKKGSSPEVDVFYRTTELFKKFPADLVLLRDVLLPEFDLGEPKVTCHFANVTIHPMYFITILPLMEDWEEELAYIFERDRYFYDWLIKWGARYVCPEFHRGIEKFSQALRVGMDAEKRLSPKMLKELQGYFRVNHPGYKREYKAGTYRPGENKDEVEAVDVDAEE